MALFVTLRLYWIFTGHAILNLIRQDKHWHSIASHLLRVDWYDIPIPHFSDVLGGLTWAALGCGFCVENWSIIWNVPWSDLVWKNTGWHEKLCDAAFVWKTGASHGMFPDPDLVWKNTGSEPAESNPGEVWSNEDKSHRSLPKNANTTSWLIRILFVQTDCRRSQWSVLDSEPPWLWPWQCSSPGAGLLPQPHWCW